jgi:hypothetical protein
VGQIAKLGRFGSNQVHVFTFWTLNLGKCCIHAEINACHANQTNELALHAWNLTSQPHYAITGGSNWAVLGQIRFVFLLFDPWNSVQPLFVLKEMHFIQTTNWISSPRLEVRSPASLRDYRWAKLPNWAVLAQTRFAFLLFEPWNSVKTVLMLKEMHVMQTKLEVALHAWNLTSQLNTRLPVGQIAKLGIFGSNQVRVFTFWPLKLGITTVCAERNAFHTNAKLN